MKSLVTAIKKSGPLRRSPAGLSPAAGAAAGPGRRRPSGCHRALPVYLSLLADSDSAGWKQQQSDMSLTV